jgi:hypothetical protein
MILLVFFVVAATARPCSAQLEIIGISSNSITVLSSITNGYTQAQARFDLKKTSEFPLAAETWHTLPICSDGVIRSHTNDIYFDDQLLEQLLWVDGSVYLRVVFATNEIPATSIRYELTIKNTSDSVITNLRVHFAGAQESYTVEELSPLASTQALRFNMIGDNGWCDLQSGITGVYDLEYDLSGQSRYYSFRPNTQRTSVSIDGTEVGLKNSSRETIETGSITEKRDRPSAKLN